MRYFNIPVFIPHLGCPFTCIFCNQNRISSQLEVPTAEQVAQLVETHLKTILPHTSEVEIAFFGGNFTAIKRDMQESYLQAVSPYLHSNRIKGIRLSTRPDCIDADSLRFLREWGVKTIELGVQSLSDEVLKASRRGYKAGDVFKACHLIREHGFRLGIQLMIGLPGDNYDLDMETTRQVISLRPDMVRIYPTLVIAETCLEGMYKAGSYIPLSLGEAVKTTAAMYLKLQKGNIPVIRMGLQPSEELQSEGNVIAGPFHPAFGELVEQEVFKQQAASAIKDFLAAHDSKKKIKIFVHPQDTSKMTGHRKTNLAYLKDSFGIKELSLHQTPDIPRDSVGVGDGITAEPALVLSRSEFIEESSSTHKNGLSNK